MISIRVIQVFLVSAVLSLVLLSWGSNTSTNNSTIVEKPHNIDFPNIAQRVNTTIQNGSQLKDIVMQRQIELVYNVL